MNQGTLSEQLAIPDGVLEPFIREAAQAIDRVHRVPFVGRIPVYYQSGRYGGYTPETEDGPRRFEISPDSPYPRLTMAHEVGHFLDDLLGHFVVYSSMEPNSPIAAVLAVIERSQAVQEIRGYLETTPAVERTVRYQLNYWLSAPEVWARAYAQYIVARSESVTLRAEVQLAKIVTGPAIYQNVQWDEEDFATIAEAIDHLFQDLGWRP
jgi:hypothetical protein